MRTSKFARLLLLGVLSLMAIGTNMACNTVHGAGKDVERTGEKMQDAADSAK
jgi:predicted small secreted protein